MKKIYFTIVGMSHYFGDEFLKPGMKVRLVKDPENEHDKEAIRVELEGLGKIGYVANSPYTVCGESFSAGRLYDKIGKMATGSILYVLPKGILCVLEGRLVFPEDECFDYYEDDDENDDDEYEDDDDDGEGRDEDNDDPFGCVIKKTLSGFEEGPVPF